MEKNYKKIDVVIDKRVYTLRSNDDENYIRALAAFVDDKLKKIDKDVLGNIKNTSQYTTLVALRIADEFFKEHQQYAKLKENDDKKATTIANLKSENAKLKQQITTLKEEIELYKSAEEISKTVNMQNKFRAENKKNTKESKNN